MKPEMPSINKAGDDFPDDFTIKIIDENRTAISLRGQCWIDGGFGGKEWRVVTCTVDTREFLAHINAEVQRAELPDDPWEWKITKTGRPPERNA